MPQASLIVPLFCLIACSIRMVIDRDLLQLTNQKRLYFAWGMAHLIAGARQCGCNNSNHMGSCNIRHIVLKKVWSCGMWGQKNESNASSLVVFCCMYLPNPDISHNGEQVPHPCACVPTGCVATQPVYQVSPLQSDCKTTFLHCNEEHSFLPCNKEHSCWLQ